MTSKRTTVALIGVVTAVAMALAVAPALMTTPASAKISSETTDTGCSNNGGNSPGGQQPTCTGGGLTQETETTNVNPSGSAPPGQNK